jgi:hypothetical protein
MGGDYRPARCGAGPFRRASAGSVVIRVIQNERKKCQTQ